MDKIEEAEQKGYELGQIVKQEELARNLRKESGEYFAGGHADERANFLRNLALRFDSDAKDARKAYDKKYHLQSLALH